MKKVLFAIFASFCLMMASASAAFAVEPYEDTSGQDACALTGYSDPLLCGTPGGDEETEIQNKVVNVLNQVYLWIGIIAVVVIVISGIKYMTSQGSTEAIQKAKAGITYASVGLVVVLGAFAITLAITNAIQGNQVATGPTGGTPVGPGGGGGGGGTPVSSLSITSGTQMMAGDTMQLRVRILPDYATDKRLTFSSSDSSVATVSSSGLVTAIKDGDVTITATAASGVTASTTIHIEKLVEVTSIKVEPTTLTVKIGKTASITATIVPSDASDKTVTWKSSNTTIATVSNTGVVTGKKEGSATITAEASNGAKATVAVTVEPNVTKYSAVQELRTYTAPNGETVQYWINVPEGATSGMPILLFLHGDGEAGYSSYVRNLTQVKMMFDANEYSSAKKFISIAPVGKQKPGGGTDWTPASIQNALKSLLDKYISEYKIDTKRVYIWGFSRGAIGTWHMVNRYPNFFAAAIPTSCGASGLNYNNFKTTKIYAISGNDYTGNESGYNREMETIVNEIKAKGGTATHITYQGLSHGQVSWKVGQSDVLESWLLKQHR